MRLSYLLKFLSLRRLKSFINNIIFLAFIVCLASVAYWLGADEEMWDKVKTSHWEQVRTDAAFEQASGSQQDKTLPQISEQKSLFKETQDLSPLHLLEQKFLEDKNRNNYRRAQSSIVTVYSNADGILKDTSLPKLEAPSYPKEPQIKLQKIATSSKAIEKIASLSDEELEAHYEEKLPEEAYLDHHEQKKQLIHHSKKSSMPLKKVVSAQPDLWGKKPLIVIVIDDMGISHKRTKDISSLKAPITSSFLTYGTQLNEQVNAARLAGHEIIIHIPMQPKSNDDLSEDLLKVSMSQQEIATNFQKMLDKFHYAVGINNHMGSLFTEHGEKLDPIMKILKKKHFFFLDSKTSSKSVGEEIAKKHGVPCTHRHVFLDNENKVPYVLKQLSRTENIARSNGFAIAIGHPKTATYQALKQWLPSLQKKGIKLIPLSQVIRHLYPNYKPLTLPTQ